MNEIKMEDPDVQDNEVVDRVLMGEVDQYEWIIRKYNQRLFRLGMSYLHQESDVQDAMQNAYLKAFKGLEGFRFNAKFSTWLMRIMINECLQVVRKKRYFEPIDFTDPAPTQLISLETG